MMMGVVCVEQGIHSFYLGRQSAKKKSAKQKQGMPASSCMCMHNCIRVPRFLYEQAKLATSSFLVLVHLFDLSRLLPALQLIKVPTRIILPTYI